MNKRVKDKQCYWCGSLDNDGNHVTINEDVPPRWLTGEKKVKESNCVPQCKTCEKNLAVLDYAVTDYFRYGAEVNLDKVVRSNMSTNNKGFAARKINLNGKEDFAQSKDCLLLWLRKLLVGLWYKEKNSRFDGSMFILAPWLSFDDNIYYVSNTVIPSEVSMSLLFGIDDFFDYDYMLDYINKITFKYLFINSSLINLPEPLQLLRFSIYGKYCGYCLFIPKFENMNPMTFFPFAGYPPLYIKYWIKGFQYYPSSTVVELVNSLKSISPEEAANRVKL